MSRTPFFSIIVPTRTRPKQLATCLSALDRLDYRRDLFEVIVVDDGSEMSLDDVVASFCSRLDLKLLRQAHAGPAAARNAGAAVAKGEFLAFTDDDCAPTSNWLQCLASRFTQAEDRALGGRTVNALPDNLYAVTSQIIVDVVYAHYNGDPNRARFFASNNLALATNCFHAVGGFDAAFFPRASEDRDLCDRWLFKGYQMTYAPEVLVYHSHPLTLRTFWRQHFNYGRGAFRFHQARARRGSGRFVTELGFYLHLPRLLWHSFSQVRRQRTLLLAALVVWQMANTMGFIWEWFNDKKK